MVETNEKLARRMLSPSETCKDYLGSQSEAEEHFGTPAMQLGLNASAKSITQLNNS